MSFNVDFSSIRTVRVHKQQFDAIDNKANVVMLTCIEDGRVIPFNRADSEKDKIERLERNRKWSIETRISQGGKILRIGDKENVNEITLRHKGRDIKFECFIKPFPYAERLDLKEKDPVEIVFDDLTEVDALIDMLKRFKQESQKYIGVWKRSGN